MDDARPMISGSNCWLVPDEKQGLWLGSELEAFEIE
jgi:hypothetical protein